MWNQHRIGLGRGGALHRPQAGITIRQNGDVLVWADPMLAQGLRDRRRARRTAVADEGEPRRAIAGAPDLAHHDFERAGRPRVPIAHIRTVEAQDHVRTGCGRLTRGCGAGARRRFPTRTVRFRTVLAWVVVESGNTSPKKSATLPNGINAASFAVRYNIPARWAVGA
jgi:hypothetical protein